MKTDIEQVKQYLNEVKDLDAILTVQSMGYDTFYWRCEEQLCIDNEELAMPIDVITAYPYWKRADIALIDFNEYIAGAHMNRIGQLRVLSRNPFAESPEEEDWGWWNDIAKDQCAVIANLFAGYDEYDMPDTSEGELARYALSCSLRGRISILHSLILKWQSEELHAMQILVNGKDKSKVKP